MPLTEKQMEEFKGMSWEEIEEELDHREKDELARQGVFLAPDHMDGYNYCPPQVLRKLRWVEAREKEFPWTTKVEWDRVPKCTSKNWTHKMVKFQAPVGKSVATITLNRAEGNNAFVPEMEDALADAIHELRRREDIRIVLLKAEGKMFCAGTDPQGYIKAVTQNSEDQNTKHALEFGKMLHAFQTLPQFTVAVVQGSAMGAGVALVCACDMAFAAQNAFFTLSDVKLGVVPGSSAPFVIQKIGVAQAKRLFCTAENCNSERALAIGLVQEVADDLDAAVRTVCEKLTLCAPQAVSAAKKMVMAVASCNIDEDLIDHTAKELARLQKAKEATDGVKAVQNRQKPAWADAQINPVG